MKIAATRQVAPVIIRGDGAEQDGRHDADPPPGRRVELEDVVRPDDEQIVVDDRRNALKQGQYCADEQQCRGGDCGGGGNTLPDRCSLGAC